MKLVSVNLVLAAVVLWTNVDALVFRTGTSQGPSAQTLQKDPLPVLPKKCNPALNSPPPPPPPPPCNCDKGINFTTNYSGLVEQVVDVKKYNRQVMTQLQRLRNSYDTLIKKHKGMCKARRQEAHLQLATRKRLIQEKDLEIAVEKERQRQCDEKLREMKQ